MTILEKGLTRRKFLELVAKGTAITGALGTLFHSEPIIAEAEGEGVVILPDKGCLFQLNDTGLFVFHHLKQ
jgi:hypothetical protein